MPALAALERLRQSAGSMSAEQLRKAVLEATGDKDEAERAYCARALQED